MLSCIAKLPDEACISHVKCIGENKSVLQLRQFAEVLFTGFTLKIKNKKLEVTTEHSQTLTLVKGRYIVGYCN